MAQNQAMSDHVVLNDPSLLFQLFPTHLSINLFSGPPRSQIVYMLSPSPIYLRKWSQNSKHSKNAKTSLMRGSTLFWWLLAISAYKRSACSGYWQCHTW